MKHDPELLTAAGAIARAAIPGDPVRDILIRARALIEDPRRWIKGSFKEQVGVRWVADVTRPSSGAMVVLAPRGEVEYGYCSVGALHEAGGPREAVVDARDRLQAAMNQIARQLGYREPMPLSVDRFNDAAQTTHAMVLEAFDRAIAA